MDRQRQNGKKGVKGEQGEEQYFTLVLPKGLGREDQSAVDKLKHRTIEMATNPRTGTMCSQGMKAG